MVVVKSFPFNQERDYFVEIESEDIEYKPLSTVKSKRKRRKTKRIGDPVKIDYKNLDKNFRDHKKFYNPKERKGVLNRNDYIHRIEQSNQILLKGVENFSCGLCGSWIDEEFSLWIKSIKVKVTEDRIGCLSPDGKYYILCHYCKNKDKTILNKKKDVEQTSLSQYF